MFLTLSPSQKLWRETTQEFNPGENPSITQLISGFFEQLNERKCPLNHFQLPKEICGWLLDNAYLIRVEDKPCLLKIKELFKRTFDPQLKREEWADDFEKLLTVGVKKRQRNYLDYLKFVATIRPKETVSHFNDLELSESEQKDLFLHIIDIDYQLVCSHLSEFQIVFSEYRDLIALKLFSVYYEKSFVNKFFQVFPFKDDTEKESFLLLVMREMPFKGAMAARYLKSFNWIAIIELIKPQIKNNQESLEFLSKFFNPRFNRLSEIDKEQFRKSYPEFAEWLDSYELRKQMEEDYRLGKLEQLQANSREIVSSPEFPVFIYTVSREQPRLIPFFWNNYKAATLNSLKNHYPVSVFKKNADQFFQILIDIKDQKVSALESIASVRADNGETRPEIYGKILEGFPSTVIYSLMQAKDKGCLFYWLRFMPEGIRNKILRSLSRYDLLEFFKISGESRVMIYLFSLMKEDVLFLARFLYSSNLIQPQSLKKFEKDYPDDVNELESILSLLERVRSLSHDVKEPAKILKYVFDQEPPSAVELLVYIVALESSIAVVFVSKFRELIRDFLQHHDNEQLLLPLFNADAIRTTNNESQAEDFDSLFLFEKTVDSTFLIDSEQVAKFKTLPTTQMVYLFKRFDDSTRFNLLKKMSDLELTVLIPVMSVVSFTVFNLLQKRTLRYSVFATDEQKLALIQESTFLNTTRLEVESYGENVLSEILNSEAYKTLKETILSKAYDLNTFNIFLGYIRTVKYALMMHENFKKQKYSVTDSEFLLLSRIPSEFRRVLEFITSVYPALTVYLLENHSILILEQLKIENPDLNTLDYKMRYRILPILPPDLIRTTVNETPGEVVEDCLYENIESDLVSGETLLVFTQIAENYIQNSIDDDFDSVSKMVEDLVRNIPTQTFAQMASVRDNFQAILTWLPLLENIDQAVVIPCLSPEELIQFLNQKSMIELFNYIIHLTNEQKLQYLNQLQISIDISNRSSIENISNLRMELQHYTRFRQILLLNDPTDEVKNLINQRVTSVIQEIESCISSMLAPQEVTLGNDEPADEFICPITQEVMEFPCSDGVTQMRFEEKAFKTFWEDTKTHPIIRDKPYDINLLKRDDELREKIVAWKATVSYDGQEYQEEVSLTSLNLHN